MEFRVLGPIEVVEDGRRLSSRRAARLALLALPRHPREPRRLRGADHRRAVGRRASRAAAQDRRVPRVPSPRRARAGASAGLAERGHRDRGRSATSCGWSRTGSTRVRFERLAAEGRALLADDPERRPGRTSRTRSALWRGEPVRGRGRRALRPARDRVAWTSSTCGRWRTGFDADLALGRHAEVIDELAGARRGEPAPRAPRGQLMVALYRAGRQAEALRTYGEGRRVLADELGIDPGPELQQLEGWILRQDPRLEPPHAAPDGAQPVQGPAAVRRGGQSRTSSAARRSSRAWSSGWGRSRAPADSSPSSARAAAASRAPSGPACSRRCGQAPCRAPSAGRSPSCSPGRGRSASWRRPCGEDRPGRRARARRELERDGDIAGAVAGILPGDVAHCSSSSTSSRSSSRSSETRPSAPASSPRSSRPSRPATAASSSWRRCAPTSSPSARSRRASASSSGRGRSWSRRSTATSWSARSSRPAEAVGVQLEPGLAAEVIADVARQPGELPLLQYALTELLRAERRAAA